ncbi:transcription termination factor Rho [Acidimicrobiia bacterium EGI L10123]|uniref:transcription termination factor Rho n=1 Tax=Salinilacustrithrix flava TaxID=2957203 RepID=UPI003D7C25DC|nr:transcription termination factor Rho [Acidimicrobiia bacterium EGI L10123]
MSVDANALERETLERKDRDELQKIVGALGGKATTRTRKADLIDQILELTGVSPAGEDQEQPSDDAASEPEAETRSEPPAAESPDTGTKDEAEEPAPERARTGVAARRAGAKADEGRGGAKQPKGDQTDKGAQDDKGGQDAKQSKGGQDTKQAKAGQDEGRGQDQGGANRDESGDDTDSSGKRRRRRGRNRDGAPSQEEYSGDPVPVVGVLDLRDDGYGFLRVDGLLPSKDDCYVSVKQVRQFGLRKGDVVAGGSRPAFRNEKNPAILHIDSVNEVALEPGTERPHFEDLTAVFPTERIALTLDDEADDRTTRAIDLLAPIGKGSRVLVLAPPRTGATTLLQAMARSVEVNEPDASLVVVLLDERPEEITEMERLVTTGTVYGSAFDKPADEHVAVLELALARAQRMAEAGDDVVLLVDGLTRLARAAHASSPGTGRSLGGLDVTAVQAAKRCFGAGRKLEEGGSVTLVATAKVDTGSDVDAAVVDAVMGAASTHIRLDRAAAERRAFPAIDVGATGTRHEERLVGDDGAEARDALRRSLEELPADRASGHSDALDGLLERLRSTGSNDELLEQNR